MNAKYGNVIDLTGTMCIYSTIQTNEIGRFTHLLNFFYWVQKNTHRKKETD